MTVDEQVEIIEKQLSNFDNMMDRLQWLSTMFDPDPAFSREARDIVRGNLVRAVDAGLPVTSSTAPMATPEQIRETNKDALGIERDDPA